MDVVDSVRRFRRGVQIEDEARKLERRDVEPEKQGRGFGVGLVFVMAAIDENAAHEGVLVGPEGDLRSIFSIRRLPAFRTSSCSAYRSSSWTRRNTAASSGFR